VASSLSISLAGPVKKSMSAKAEKAASSAAGGSSSGYNELVTLLNLKQYHTHLQWISDCWERLGAAFQHFRRKLVVEWNTGGDVVVR
jgi:hypothetical protein